MGTKFKMGDVVLELCGGTGVDVHDLGASGGISVKPGILFCSISGPKESLESTLLKELQNATTKLFLGK